MTASPDSPSVETITGNQLTPEERKRLVWMLGVARDRVIPSALGVIENRLGESPAQDFYFRLFLAHMLKAAELCGVAAMAGSIDDVWGLVDDAYEEAKRACGPRTRRCTRETVRQLLSSPWRKSFDAAARAYTFDERDLDWEPEQGATVAFSFTSDGESKPVALSATVCMFRRDDGSRVDLILPKLLPDPCRVDPIEKRSLPRDNERLCEQSAVVLRAIIRLLREEPRELTKQLRKLAASETADAERTQRFQATLGQLRRDGASTAALEELHDILNDPDADIREGYAAIDRLRSVSPSERRSTLNRIWRVVAGATACLLFAFLALYYSPTPLGAAVRARVHRFFDRIVSERLFSTLIGSDVDGNRGVFVLPDGAVTPEIRSKHGSSIRLAPGLSQNLLNVAASFSNEGDIAEIRDYVVPLGGFDSTGLAAMQYRKGPHEPPIPWVVEVALIPQQDADLIAELSAKRSQVTWTYSPAVTEPVVTRISKMTVLEGKAHVRYVFATELREFPHVGQAYTVTAAIRRAAGRIEVYTGELRLSESGFATLSRTPGAGVARIGYTLQILEPRCTTILNTNLQGVVMAPGRRDAIMTQAHIQHEQDVTFQVGYPQPPPGEGEATGCTIDFGDGSPAYHGLVRPGESRAFGVGATRHTYRVGDRPYLINVYFDNSSVVYAFELYVFANRSLPAAEKRMTYATPFAPNEDDMSLAFSAVKRIGAIPVSYVFREPTELNMEAPLKVQTRKP